MLLVGNRKRLAYSFGSLLALHFLSAILLYDFYYTCDNSPYARTTNPDQNGTALIHSSWRDFMFFIGIRFFLIYLVGRFISVMLYAHRTNQRNPSLLQRAILCILILTMVFGGYFIGLILMNFAKKSTNDFACHTKSNGVSGHAYFAVWAFAMLIHFSDIIGLMEDNMDSFDPNTNNNNKPEYAVELMHLAFSVPPMGIMSPLTVVCSAIFLATQLFFTFWYGYHSMKQMVYGALFGICWSILTTLSVDWIVWKVSWSPFFQKGKHL